ncbi:MAG: MltA domain-containing protein [Deltaproteobacteria bacterium]|nr:MltA domain-containing protein [Deltaproteobacteria bacterium]
MKRFKAWRMVGSRRYAAGRKFLSITAFCFLVTACPGASTAEGAGQTGLPVFKDDLGRDSLHRAIQRSLEFLQRLPSGRAVGEWPRKITAGEVRQSLLLFMERLDLVGRPAALLPFIRAQFDLFRSDGERGDGDVLFTGYYQPVIAGSLVETEEFRFPIYGRPKDLLELDVTNSTSAPEVEKVVGRMEGERFARYFSRYEIDRLGRIRGRGYEIAWAKDPVALFFLHIQGSGLLRLPDGRLLPLNYAGSNGRPYTSIGRLLVESGKVVREGLTMQRLRGYLKDHPEERDALLARNESYIFFRFGDEGPMGSLEVPLTPGRSIATDARIFPKGGLAFVVSQRPALSARGEVIRWLPFSRFVLNQDTGSAIQGRGRVDLYFGSGSEAGSAAGAMHRPGKLYFLIQKQPLRP